MIHQHLSFTLRKRTLSMKYDYEGINRVQRFFSRIGERTIMLFHGNSKGTGEVLGAMEGGISIYFYGFEMSGMNTNYR